MKIIFYFILLFILNFTYHKFNGGELNSLEYFDIKKYFRCDIDTNSDILTTIKSNNVSKCLLKCLYDMTCTCLHYNSKNKTCYMKHKTIDITSDNKKLIYDNKYTGYIKKNDIRNLTKNYMFITFIEYDKYQPLNTNINIIYLLKNSFNLNNIIPDNTQYSFYLKDIYTNDIVDNILNIIPKKRYSIGYIDILTNLEHTSDYLISFSSIIKKNFFKNSLYNIYIPNYINFFDSSGNKIKINSNNPFYILVLNNTINNNITISTETSNTNIYNNQKYFISYHNFNNNNSHFKSKNFLSNKHNIHCIWDLYFKKNTENFFNFCNNKYSFTNDSITNKDCVLNNIWKINYNNYNNTYNFNCFNSNFDKTKLQINSSDNPDNKNKVHQFMFQISHIKKIDNDDNIKFYYKIFTKTIINGLSQKKFLYMNKFFSSPNFLNKFCYHYLKYNNIKFKHYKPHFDKHNKFNLTKIPSNKYKVDDFDTCIQACDETNNNNNECLYLNFLVNNTTQSKSKSIQSKSKSIQSKSESIQSESESNKIYSNISNLFEYNQVKSKTSPNSYVDNTYLTTNEHAHIKSDISNLYNVDCQYYTNDTNYTQEKQLEIHKTNHHKYNNSIHLKKIKYFCNKTNNKPIQDLLFNLSDYYNNTDKTQESPQNSSENIILYWNIDILQHKYKKHLNKKNDLNKISPPQYKHNFYWSNLKKNIGDIGLGLSCSNYKELGLNNIKNNTIETEELISPCKTNNCNYNILKEQCDNDPICTNFQISKDKTTCYTSHLNNIYLLQNDKNPDTNKIMDTYFKEEL